MDSTPPSFTSMITPDAPRTWSVRPGTCWARERSSTSWRRRSTVRITLSPGAGYFFQVSLTTLPSVLRSTVRVPLSPRRYCSKASSTPSLPTMSFMP